MREDWKIMRLGDIVEIKRGLTYSKNDEVETSEKIVLRSNNINLDNHQFDFTELKYLKPSFDIPADIYLQKGDLLMCMSNGSKAHLGKVALYEGDSNRYAFGGFMAALSHKDSVIGKYLFYAMTTPMYKEYIKALSDGANINNLKVRDIEAFTIPVPPLAEQERIVALLDDQFAKIDQLRANADLQLRAAKDLFQSALKQLLTPQEGWEEISIVDACESIFAGGDAPKGRIKESIDGKFCYPIFSNGVEKEGLYGYTDDFRVNKPAITIAARGTIGAAFIRTTPFTPIVRLITLIPNNKAHISFLYYLIKSLNIGHTGSSIPQLTVPMIKEMTFSFPPLAEQERIAARLDAISEKVKALQANYDQTITLCNDLKQALLKSIFA